MILLDTHVLLWQDQGDRRLGSRARSTLDRGLRAGNVAMSAISFWEVGMHIQKGRLGFDLALDAWRRSLLEQGLIEIPLDGAIAARAGMLGNLHGDPADRLIIATALEGHQLLTADEHILNWPGDLARIDARD